MSDWTPHADAVVRAVPEDEAVRAVRDALEKRYRALIERLREAGDETWANNLAGYNSHRSEPARCSLAVLEMMVDQIHSLRTERDTYRALAKDLYDEGECWFDHHGGCQAHGWLEPGPGETCPDGRAQRLFKGGDNNADGN